MYCPITAVHTIPVESMHSSLTLKVLPAHIYTMEVFSFYCHFWQCPWEIGSVGAERGGTKGGGWVPNGANSMAASESGFH